MSAQYNGHRMVLRCQGVTTRSINLWFTDVSINLPGNQGNVRLRLRRLSPPDSEGSQG